MSVSSDNDVTTNGAPTAVRDVQRALDRAVSPSVRATIERASRILSSPGLDTAYGQAAKAFQQLEAREHAARRVRFGAAAEALQGYGATVGASEALRKALDGLGAKLGASKALRDALDIKVGVSAEWSRQLSGTFGPRPEWAGRYARTLGNIDLGRVYGAQLSGLAAWRPQTTALNNLLTTRIPPIPVMPLAAPVPRDPLGGPPPDLAARLREDARTVAELTPDIDFESVVDDSEEFVEQLACARCQHNDATAAASLRWARVAALTSIVTMLITAGWASTDPDVQKAVVQMVERLQAIIRSLGG